MSDYEVIETGNMVYVGSQGVAMHEVLIGAERFGKGASGALYRECWKCPDFSGKLREFAGIFEGECFGCYGRGYTAKVESVAKAVSLAKRRVTDRERRQRKADEKAAAQRAAVQVWREANPEVAAACDEVMADAPAQDADFPEFDAWSARWSDFVTSLANQAQFRPLSEKQTAAFLPAIAEAKAAAVEAAEVAAKQRYAEPGADGKVKVVGIVRFAKSFEGDYGMYRLAIIDGIGEDEGITVKMQGTSKAVYSVAQGDEVEIVAAVKKQDEYDGVPQTVVVRPQVRVLAKAVAE